MSFLVANDQWIAWALCGIALLVVPVFLWKVVRPRWGELFANRPALSWALVGLVWWTCLTQSAAGLVVLAVAAYFAIKGLRTKRAVATS
jgi:hypothetical protein